MRKIAVYCILIVFAFSCGNDNLKLPRNVFEEVHGNAVVHLDEESPSSPIDKQTICVNDSVNTTKDLIDLDSLIYYMDYYKVTGKESALEKATDFWYNLRDLLQTEVVNMSQDQVLPDMKRWFELNSRLLKLTGNPHYAEELEQASRIINDGEVIKSMIYTMDTDNVYVNLFTPSSLNFTHSLGGEVTINQETKYPEGETIAIHFKMEIKRYMQVYIRIPSWADNAEVEVRKVKYFAPPGTYCKIAKNWKEGDRIDIHFPKKKV